MATVDSYNPYVFDEVKKLLESKYSGNSAFDNTTIILGSNVCPVTPEEYRATHPGQKIIVYNMEQLFRGSYWVNDKTMHWFVCADEVWDYDIENVQFFKAHGIKAFYRPMEYNECMLYGLPTVKKDIDVLFYGGLTDRRMKILQSWIQLSQHHATTVIATGIKGTQLAEYVMRSKIVLNLHAYPNIARQEQVRMFTPVINGICVVSEKSNYNEFGQSIVESSTKGINLSLKNLLKSGEWMKVAANAPLAYKAHCGTRQM